MAKTIIQLPKEVKRQLSTIADPAVRAHYKKAMLEAESALLSSKNRKFSDPAVSQRRDRQTQA